MLILTYSAVECFVNFDIFIIYDLLRFFNRIFEIYYILSVCNRDVKERQKSQTCVTVKLRKQQDTKQTIYECCNTKHLSPSSDNRISTIGITVRNIQFLIILKTTKSAGLAHLKLSSPAVMLFISFKTVGCFNVTV